MKIDKKKITGFILVMFLNCGSIVNSDTVQNINNNFEKIQFIYIDMSVLTPYKITCNRFDREFLNIKKQHIVNDKSSIDSIIDFIEITKLNNKSLNNLDIRFQMIMFRSNNVVDTICGNQFGIQIDEKFYRINEDFTEFISKRLK